MTDPIDGTGGVPLLEATNLTVRYGKVTALDGLDVAARPGEVLAVLGPNGAGKTTFLRAIATLIAPSGGHVRVRGFDVVKDSTAVRREIGLAGQFAAVEPTLTGRENLEMVAHLFGQRGKAAAAAARRVIEMFGLEEVADRRSSTYSGGQRRRLDLGASLVGAPRLLLLDEPTTGLDPVGRVEVWDAVRALVATGTDILLTTHYLEEADELADQVVVIDHGKAIANGTVAELKAGVGRDVIEVAVVDLDQLAMASQLLQQLIGGKAIADHAGRRVHIAAESGASQLSVAITALEEAGVLIDEIALRHPTLDEVFLALTTDHMRDETSLDSSKVASRP